MKQLLSSWRRRLHKSGAHMLVEYSLVLVLVSIVGVVLLHQIGSTTNRLLDSTRSNLPP